MLTHCGVTQCARGDFTGDDLSRVETDALAEGHPVRALDVSRQLGCLLLDGQCGETRSNRVVLQGDPRADHRHDPVAGDQALPNGKGQQEQKEQAITPGPRA